MTTRMMAATAAVLAIGLAAAGWCLRDPARLSSAKAAIGLSPATPPSLQAAGVHKCVGARGTGYSDGPCPAGSREAATGGGTVTVMSFPPPPAPSPAALAASALGGPLVKPMDPAERERLREKAVDAALNRP